MEPRINTICHADRVRHAFFGDIDVINLVRDPGDVLPGAIGWAQRPGAERVKIRVKGLWKDLDHDDPHTLVVVIEPLPFHPAELEGCALEWECDQPPPPFEE